MARIGPLATQGQTAKGLRRTARRPQIPRTAERQPPYSTKPEKTQNPFQTKPPEQVAKPKRPREEDTSQETPLKRARIESSDIDYWVETSTWPGTYFENNKMSHLLARKGSSLGRKRSSSSLSGAGDEKQREEKSAPYRNPSYPTFLIDVANYKSHMEDHKLGISDASEKLLERLLHTEQCSPEDTLFDGDSFRTHIQKLEGKNEARVLQDISLLLVPSIEGLASRGAHHLCEAVEGVNERWNKCFPITKPCPQPDSSFGCGMTAFSDDQLDKLRPTIGDSTSFSIFKAAYYMLFPFLTKEVKTGTMGLDIADRQNAHSATIAVGAVVELFRLVGREKELHREIVALAISHDNKSVRLYAHYPYIDGDKITIWRHTIDQFYLDAKTKWRSRTFTINAFNIFYPIHLKRIRSAIDDIAPSQSFSRQSDTQSLGSAVEDQDPISQTSGLSQHLDHQHLDEVLDSELGSRQITPTTSIQTEPKSPERKKKKGEQRVL